MTSALRSASFVVLAVLLTALAGAEPITGIPNPRIKNGTWVSDNAGALRADTIATLNRALGAAEREHGIEVVVVVIRSLDGSSVEDVAEKLFKLWGIGKKGRDNGLLFLWSTGDRKVRVEVGYGLEGILPDGKAGSILDAYVIPQFKAGQFDAGVIAGVNALLRAAQSQPVALPAISKSYDTSEPQVVRAIRPPSTLRWWMTSWVPWLAGVPLFFIVRTALRRWRRNRRRRCPECRSWMVRLSETDDDALLDKGQMSEEQVGSVDYDVWKCPSCAHHFTIRYPKWATKYDTCPQCSNRTKWTTETVVERATTHGAGLAKVAVQCAFCNFKSEYEKVLPQIQSTSSGSSGSSWSSGSSGGSSFGGGRSGGGGASRGY